MVGVRKSPKVSFRHCRYICRTYLVLVLTDNWICIFGHSKNTCWYRYRKQKNGLKYKVVASSDFSQIVHMILAMIISFLLIIQEVPGQLRLPWSNAAYFRYTIIQVSRYSNMLQMCQVCALPNNITVWLQLHYFTTVGGHIFWPFCSKSTLLLAFLDVFAQMKNK